MSTAEIDARLATAQELWQQDRVADTEQLLRELVGRHPRREDVALLLAEVLRSQGKLDAASQVVLRLCRDNGFEPGLCLRVAVIPRQCGRHAIAGEICRQALAHGAGPPADLLVLAGHVARESGDFATARARYLAALGAGVDLERHYILGALAHTRRYTDPADPDIVLCRRHFHDGAHSARLRASAGFGLGKILDDLGDYASATQALRQANAMLHALHPWDAAAWRAFVDARLHERVAAAQGEAAPGFVPVFIVGVPRTGTTLTASLLARAMGARDRGELRTLRFIGEKLTAGGLMHNAGSLGEAARMYQSLSRQDDSAAACYLDQDPLNFRWLHVVAAMFPQARVIHLRRDCRDTALSQWSQEFAHPDMAFSYDFGGIDAFIAGHDRLMRYWTQHLPLPIFELDYETLVTEPEPAVAKLREFIGVPARDPATPDDDAPVESASVWQARQPVYATSVGRWKHYAPYLPELGQFITAK